MDPSDPDFLYLGVDRKALLKEFGDSFDSKKNFWAPDEKDGYIAVTVEETTGDKVTVKTEKGEVNIFHESISLCY